MVKVSSVILAVSICHTFGCLGRAKRRSLSYQAYHNNGRRFNQGTIGMIECCEDAALRIMLYSRCIERRTPAGLAKTGGGRAGLDDGVGRAHHPGGPKKAFDKSTS